MSFIDIVDFEAELQLKRLQYKLFCKYCCCVLAFEQLSGSTISFIDAVVLVTGFRTKTIATRW